eukprot:Skav221907  [mRNA]  locus=scaffold1640:67042:69607:+ [translate_table: standard]
MPCAHLWGAGGAPSGCDDAASHFEMSAVTFRRQLCPPCVLWPSAPEDAYLTGDALHRLGQNSAMEYYNARDKGNIQHVDEQSELNTSFWVLRAQATDKVAPAYATVSKPLAENLVKSMMLGGKELAAALEKAGIFEANPARVSTSKLELLFRCHCVVIDGEFPAKYFRRCFSHPPNAGRKICTCANFAQRGNCPHVWYIAAVQNKIDLTTIPTRAKPGRKRGRSVAGQQQGQRAKFRRK